MEWDDYEAIETLSSNRTTALYRVAGRANGGKYIIKAQRDEHVPPQERERLRHEANCLQAVHSDFVLKLERFVDLETGSFLVFPDTHAEPLEGQRLSISDFLDVATAIAQALKDVHAARLIHGNIQPCNILKVSDGYRLIDFGSAMFDESKSESLAVTATPFEGSAAYMSPEQTGRMNRRMDYRSDFYSLGITFFELLSGTRPFDAKDLISWVHCHLSKPAPRLHTHFTDIPKPLSEIVYKLMAKEPDARYQGATGLLKDLLRCQTQWTKNRAIAPFSLGEHDISQKFRISEHLVGREEPSAILLDCLTAAVAGQTQFVWLEGAAGVGKSALLASLQEPGEKLGLQVHVGSFSSLEQNTPYSALVRVISSVVKNLLSLPDDELAKRREALQQAIEPNGRLLSDWIPNTSQVLGEQPLLAELGSAEALLRFRTVVRQFLKELSASTPLVLVLEDLQWADESSLGLIADWLNAGGLGKFALVGAWNPALTSDLCKTTIESLVQHPACGPTVQLGPLSLAHFAQITHQSLGGDRASAHELAQILYEKTAGNPQFFVSLLRQLHEKGAIGFSQETGSWMCDLGAATALAVSANVAELMVERLRAQPSDVLLMIELVAVAGGQIEASTLQLLTPEIAEPENLRSLQAAQRGGFLVQDIEGLFSVSDDRIQQAAYELLSLQERQQAHLSLGRILAEQASSDILTTVNHFNRGSSRITTQEEHDQVVELNRRAAKRAISSAAFSAALTYLDAALASLDKGSAAARAQLNFQLNMEAVECLYQLANVDEAQIRCTRLSRAAETPLQQALVLTFQARVAEHRAEMLEALKLLRQGLALLGIVLPEDHTEIQKGIGIGIEQMTAHLQRVPLEQIPSLPEMTDPERALAMRMLYDSVACAIQTYPPLFILAELLMFDLSMTHGLNEYSCKNVMDCGIIRGTILGDYGSAFRFGQTAFELVERYRPTAMESATAFVYASFIAHWRAPLQEGFEAYEKVIRTGEELGDIQHMLYAKAHYLHRLLIVGRPLETIRDEYGPIALELEQAKAHNPIMGLKPVKYALEVLTGIDTTDFSQNERDASAWEEIRDFGNAQWAYTHCQMQVSAHIFLGDWARANLWQNRLEPFLPAGSTLFAVPETVLCTVLLLCQGLPKVPVAQRDAENVVLEEHLARLRGWHEGFAENFAHKYHLAAAEIGRAWGHPTDEVVGHYEAAVAAASTDFVQFRALALELHSQYWSEKGQMAIAQGLRMAAFEAYEFWGATRKTAKMQSRYPELKSHHSRESSQMKRGLKEAHTQAEHSLDLISVLKSTQAISSEVKSAQLFEKLMLTIVENAGAQSGVLISCGDDEQLRVEAIADESGSRSATSKQLEDNRLCLAIVRYVVRSAEAIVIDDAQEDPQYRQNPYVQRHLVRSVLCIPVMNRGKLVAVLYAENNAISRAFVEERIAALRMIASQAAISIANAQLYESLEEKVELRTAALRQKTDDVVGLLENIQQGLCTIQPDNTIHPEYSKHLEVILEEEGLSGKTLTQTLLRDTDLAENRLATTNDLIELSFDTPAFLFETNEHCLPTEFHITTRKGTKKLVAVEWIAIADADENIRSVMVTIKDISELRALQNEAEQRKEQMHMVEELLGLTAEEFLDFAQASQVAISRNMQLIEAKCTLSESRDELFRNTHTIKGNAGVLGLSALVEVAHEVEDSYRHEAEQEPSRTQLLANEARLATCLEKYSQAFDEHLAKRTKDTASIPQQLKALIAEAKERALDGETLLQRLESLYCKQKTLGELLTRPALASKRLAVEQNKEEPHLKITGSDIVVTEKVAGKLRDIFAHVFRNSVDHGIETPTERLAQGKLEAGLISIEANESEGALVVYISDDGRGLALEKLKQKYYPANDTETNPSDLEVANTIFRMGTSTADCLTAISGRGVGMEVVRTFMQEVQGLASVELTGATVNGYAPFRLKLSCDLVDTQTKVA